MNKRELFEAIAESLRDFGYPSADASQVADTWAAMEACEPIPHGIVGSMAEGQLRQVADAVRDMRP